MSLQEYKCPNCNGAITFDASSQQMVCPYCDATFDAEALKSYDDQLSQQTESEAIDWGFTGSEWQEGEQAGMLVYTCKSCGGEIVGNESLGATMCPFCGNQVVMTSQFSGTLRPDIIIPFQIDKAGAKAALAKHYLGKKLLPKVFKDQNHLDEIKGIYVPFWLFDADADASVRYKATTVTTWTDSDYRYTRTSFFNVLREGGLGFNSVPVDGSSNMDDTLMESIEPFDWTKATDFQTAYMAGYLANKYDVDAEASVDHANDRIRRSTEVAFRDTVKGYATVTPEYTNIRLKSGGIRYALLPVWLLSTSWNGGTYTFAMNGQTGKFVGDLPLDKGAFARWFFGLFGISTAVFALIATLVVLLS